MSSSFKAVPDAWDHTADLVVLGSGAAGLTGAAVAAAEGLDVVLLEKSDLIGGTTAVSGGGVWVPCNHHLAEAGVEDSREEALEYVRACAGEAGDDDVLVALIDNAPPAARYLEERLGVTFRTWPVGGGTLDYRPWLPGARFGGRTLDGNRFTLAELGEWASRLRLGATSAWTFDRLDYYAKRMHTMPPTPGAAGLASQATDVEHVGAGASFAGQLLRACLAEGVTVLPETPATELVVEDGRVVGVRATQGGAPIAVRARRGVLVATGGYAHNEELKRMWMSRPLQLSCEVEENQGDGHLMGMAIGAQTANLGDAWWMPHFPMAPEDELGPTNVAGTREDRSLPHTLIVNKHGKRFVNEAMNYYDIVAAFGTKADGPRNLPAWLVFDAQGRDRYAMLAWKVNPEGTPKPPWLVVADSVADLASQLGVDEAALSETLERFNGFARDGRDLDFQRGETRWDVEWGDAAQKPNPSLGTVEKPPFYAVEVRSGALATKGGLRVDPQGRVLSAGGDRGPIPGLYAAGNASSGGVPGAYPGAGATLGAAMTFAFLAAQHAASAAPAAELDAAASA
jgi:3-oxosteroid 1-dehydrogenase